MTATAPTAIEQLIRTPWGGQVYILIRGRRRPLRFTKFSNTGWKRSDGLAPAGVWLNHEELAALGEIVPPPFRKGATDGTANT